MITDVLSTFYNIYNTFMKKISTNNNSLDTTIFSATKIRKIVKYNDCGTWRCLISDYVAGSKKGPSKKEVGVIEASLKSGLICLNDVKFN